MYAFGFAISLRLKPSRDILACEDFCYILFSVCAQSVQRIKVEWTRDDVWVRLKATGDVKAWFATFNFRFIFRDFVFNRWWSLAMFKLIKRLIFRAPWGWNYLQLCAVWALTTLSRQQTPKSHQNTTSWAKWINFGSTGLYCASWEKSYFRNTFLRNPIRFQEREVGSFPA